MINPIEFSIVIPTYNRKPFVQKAIQSVLDQTYPHWELIVIDDGSNDGTAELLASYQDQRIHYYSQDNHGVSHARNQGVECARHEWIVLLDSDDWFLPTKLERSVEYIQRYADIKFFHTEETWYRHGQLLEQKSKHKNPDGWVYRQVVGLCCVSASTVVIHREVFNSIGLFDEQLEACEDYDLWLRIATRYAMKLIPEALTEKDGGRDDQLTSTIWGLDRFRIEALRKKLESGDLNQDDWDYTCEVLKNKCAVYLKGAIKRNKSDEVDYYERLMNRYATSQT